VMLFSSALVLSSMLFGVAIISDQILGEISGHVSQNRWSPDDMKLHQDTQQNRGSIHCATLRVSDEVCIGNIVEWRHELSDNRVLLAGEAGLLPNLRLLNLISDEVGPGARWQNSVDGIDCQESCGTSRGLMATSAARGPTINLQHVAS
jgi:hypothetical protein